MYLYWCLSSKNEKHSETSTELKKCEWESASDNAGEVKSASISEGKGGSKGEGEGVGKDGSKGEGEGVGKGARKGAGEGVREGAGMSQQFMWLISLSR